jgi:LTXXQ motif family protein
MRTSRKMTIAAMVLGVAGLAAAAASAHPYGHGPGPGIHGGMMGWGPGGGAGFGPGAGMGPRGYGPGGFANPSAAAETRLNALKSELKITSGQEAAWQAFAGAAKEQAESMQGWRTAIQGSTPSPVERMELRTKVMKERLAQAEKSNAAFKNLYAELSPEQKTLANERLGGGVMAGGFGPGRRFR